MAQLSRDTYLVVGTAVSEPWSFVDHTGEVRASRSMVVQRENESAVEVHLVRLPAAEELFVSQLRSPSDGCRRIIAVPVDLMTLARQELTVLRSMDRHRLARFIPEAVSEIGGGCDRSTLGTSLAWLQDVLTPRLPPSRGGELAVMALCAADERTFLVQLEGRTALDAPVTVTSPEGFVANVIASTTAGRGGRSLHQILVRTAVPTDHTEGWRIDIADGEVSLPAARLDRSPTKFRTALVRALQRSETDDALFEFTATCLSVLAENLRRECRVQELGAFGTTAAGAQLTVVIELTDSVDAAAHHLAVLQRNSPRRVELLFVLTEPALLPCWQEVGGALHELYGLSFRAAVTTRAVGYATAINASIRTVRTPWVIGVPADAAMIADRWGSFFESFASVRGDAHRAAIAQGIGALAETAVLAREGGLDERYLTSNGVIRAWNVHSGQSVGSDKGGADPAKRFDHWLARRELTSIQPGESLHG